MDKMINIEEQKLKTLISYFHEVCSLCDECDIYEHEELDEHMQSLKNWVEQNFPR